MKKTLPAFIAALLMTAILGGGMFLMGQQALGVSTVKAASVASDASASEYLPVIVEYQTREAQYQETINQAAQQIKAANQQIDAANQQIEAADQQILAYQNLLMELQNTGLITIDNNGNVTINSFNPANSFGEPAVRQHH